MERFTGTMEVLTDVDVSLYVDWLQAIPTEEWRKSTDMAWRGWGEKFKPLASELIDEFFPGCRASGYGLFLLEFGSCQLVHQDEQVPNWIVRVHVPIVTNPHAVMTFDDWPRHMEVGRAYKFNTLAPHSLYNGGKTPRMHFVFDVVENKTW